MKPHTRNILIHFIACFVFLSMPVLFSPDFSENFNIIFIRPFQIDFLYNVLLIGVFYLFFYVLIPQFYLNKRWIQFFGLVLIIFLVVSFLPDIIIPHHNFPPDHHADNHNMPPPPKHFKLFFLGHRLLQYIIIVVLSLIIKLIQRLKQIEEEKAVAELSYLKAQINPHFLFNTLNSIYSLSILKHEKTPNAIIKLSEMMRYVLNENHHNFVLLENEIKYISNYIELQQLRLDSSVQLVYKCEGNVYDKKIAPLVLIPFIENAFKHGVNSEEPSNIEILISISDSQLNLLVKNNCVLTNNNTLNKSGLGIENTKKRLEFLYPQNHILSITENDNLFIVNLSLNIHD
jgi:hypothetical protein